MALQIIPAILASGYGVSFSQIVPTYNEDHEIAGMTFPEKQTRGDLVLGYDDETQVVIPMIRIGTDITVCVAFTVYVPDVGWRSVDITKLPGNLAELEHMASFETMELKMMDPVRDMSGYEIINAWEEQR